MKTQKRGKNPIRPEAEHVPHTDELDILVPSDGTIIRAYSGHTGIALQTMTALFSVMEPQQRAFMWAITFNTIRDIAASEGWIYIDQYLLREYDADTEPGSVLIEHEQSGDRVIDRIWLLKNILNKIGVVEYHALCEQLASTDPAVVAAAQKKHDPTGVIFAQHS